MKKILEVQPIEETGTVKLTAENIRDFIEEPLVDAVVSLYNKNILTYMASANRKDVNGNAYISFYYDKLSEENKMVVHEKIKEKIDGYEIGKENLIGTVVRLSMPITEQTTVDEVENFFLARISDLKIQDLQCRKYTSKCEIIEAYFAFAEYKSREFMQDIHDFFEENYELENEENPCLEIDDNLYDYESALKCLVEEHGFVYSDEENTLYETEEEYRRHRCFLESQKSELVQKEEELASLETMAKKISEEESTLEPSKEGYNIGDD